MALFTRKENAAAPKAKDVKAAGARPAVSRNLSAVLKKPHITEKAVAGSERNVYTFIIHPDATKRDVMDAVKAVYSVTPVRVNIVNREARQYTSRRIGRKVIERAEKKAYVYLKKGDSISLV